MKPINWKTIAHVLNHVIQYIVYWTIGFLLVCVSIEVGSYDTYVVLMIGVIVGIAIGWVLFNFIIYKPMEKMYGKCWRIQEKFIDDLANKLAKPPKDGDEWKDN